MNKILTIVLALVCGALIVALFLTKRTDNAQFEADATGFNECSNTMVAAQAQVAGCNATISTLSNSLDACQSASVATSNALVTAQTTIAQDADEISRLTTQAAQSVADNQSLGRQVTDLTNQVSNQAGQIATLNEQVSLTATNLTAVQHDHMLLEERLRRDVAERLVVERKFYNFDALQAQMDKLKSYPGLDVTADKIYAGLNVEVRSNGSIHVISPE